MKRIKIKHVENNYNGMYYLRTAKKENIEVLKNVIYADQFGMSRKYKLLH